MKNYSEDLKQLRSKAETAMNKTAQLEQVLAQIEAMLSRKEIQKVKEKSKQ